MKNLMLEVASPPISWSDERKQEWTEEIISLIERNKIENINISEVLNEVGHGKRNIPFLPKMDNLEFAQKIKHKLHSLQTILCKVSVQLSEEQFVEWVRQASDKGFRNIVIVGGEKEYKTKGISVNDAARCIVKKLPGINVGGIIIFSRKDEVQRIIEKMNHGVSFFLSQIIFEFETVKQIVLELNEECKKRNLPFPLIYLAIAPAAKLKDLNFLEWLGINIPKDVMRYLLQKGEEEIAERTFHQNKKLITDLTMLFQEHQLPFGFNVEPVMYGNLSLAEQLIVDLRTRFGE